MFVVKFDDNTYLHHLGKTTRLAQAVVYCDLFEAAADAAVYEGATCVAVHVQAIREV